MIRRVSAPLHVKSENKYRGFTGGFVAASSSAKTRREVGLILTQIPKPALKLSDVQDNHFVVRLTRISPGYLDDDNLRGAFKATRDEVAAWIGINDGHHRIRFEYHQEGCRRGLFGIRIEVEDLAPGETFARDLAGIPNVTHEPPRPGAPKVKRTPMPPKQVEIMFRKSFAVLPWEHDGGDPQLTELAVKALEPPKLIRMRVPARVLSSAASVRFAAGALCVLERNLFRHDGEEIWLYTARDGST